MYSLFKNLVRFLSCVGIVILCTRCTTTHQLVTYKEFEEGEKASIILTDGDLSGCEEDDTFEITLNILQSNTPFGTFLEGVIHYFFWVDGQ